MWHKAHLSASLLRHVSLLDMLVLHTFLGLALCIASNVLLLASLGKETNTLHKIQSYVQSQVQSKCKHQPAFRGRSSSSTTSNTIRSRKTPGRYQWLCQGNTGNNRLSYFCIRIKQFFSLLQKSKSTKQNFELNRQIQRLTYSVMVVIMFRIRVVATKYTLEQIVSK